MQFPVYYFSLLITQNKNFRLGKPYTQTATVTTSFHWWAGPGREHTEMHTFECHASHGMLCFIQNGAGS